VSPVCRGDYSFAIACFAMLCVGYVARRLAGTYTVRTLSSYSRDHVVIETTKGYVLHIDMFGCLGCSFIAWWLAGGLFTLLVERWHLGFVLS
jgi:hypothetical protein